MWSCIVRLVVVVQCMFVTSWSYRLFSAAFVIERSGYDRIQTVLKNAYRLTSSIYGASSTWQHAAMIGDFEAGTAHLATGTDGSSYSAHSNDQWVLCFLRYRCRLRFGLGTVIGT